MLLVWRRMYDWRLLHQEILMPCRSAGGHTMLLYTQRMLVRDIQSLEIRGPVGGGRTLCEVWRRLWCVGEVRRKVVEVWLELGWASKTSLKGLKFGVQSAGICSGGSKALLTVRTTTISGAFKKQTDLRGRMPPY